MFLWHGTYWYFKEDILKTKKLSCRSEVGETTKEINDLFKTNLGFNPRENCVYFSGDNESTYAFDYAFMVDTNKMNLKKLFVGDYQLIDEALMADTSADITELLKRYYETLIPFEEYLKNTHNFLNRDIWELEFLYFDDIEIVD